PFFTLGQMPERDLLERVGQHLPNRTKLLTAGQYIEILFRLACGLSEQIAGCANHYRKAEGQKDRAAITAWRRLYSSKLRLTEAFLTAEAPSSQRKRREGMNHSSFSPPRFLSELCASAMRRVLRIHSFVIKKRDIFSHIQAPPLTGSQNGIVWISHFIFS